MRSPWEEFAQKLGSRVARHIPLPWAQFVESRANLLHMLTRLDINCVLDVGANEGQFATTLWELGYTGWVVSFEPVPETFRLLQREAARHGRWRVFPFALGAGNGTLPLHVSDITVYSSFRSTRPSGLERFPDMRTTRLEPVEMRRLDDTLDECLAGIDSPRLYLKLDTQGFDLEVVRGGERTLERVLALQTEVSFQPIYDDMPDFTESIRALQQRGFDVVSFAPVTSDFDDLRAIEMDCILARPTPTPQTDRKILKTQESVCKIFIPEEIEVKS